MPDVYVETRRTFLLSTQNLDGGWAYFPGKASWLEPTAYAMLALHGYPPAQASLRRAWNLVRSWQLPDGSCRPGSQVQDGAWVTALALTLSCVIPDTHDTDGAAINYLLNTEGAERCAKFRIMEFLGLGHIEDDTNHPAWPWRAGTSSWIEPTAHSVIALKKAYARTPQKRILNRIREGENMILARRCADGGWNHGASVALKIPINSYPESTGLALLALQGRARDIGGAVRLARTYHNQTTSPLARAWLSIALQAWGDAPAAVDDNAPPPGDIMLAALQAIAHPFGNHELLRTAEVV